MLTYYTVMPRAVSRIVSRGVQYIGIGLVAGSKSARRGEDCSVALVSPVGTRLNIALFSQN